MEDKCSQYPSHIFLLYKEKDKYHRNMICKKLVQIQLQLQWIKILFISRKSSNLLYLFLLFILNSQQIKEKDRLIFLLSTMEAQKPLIESQYKQSPYRFIIISVYLLASLVNGIPNSNFAAMVTIVERTFGTPTILITLNYLVFPISHALFAAPVNWCLTKKGLRFSYHIASVTMIVGVWLRTTLSEDNPYICLLGSIICGFGYLFVMNSASKVTMNWFRSEVMTSVTFVSALSTMLSLSFSSIIPGFLLDSSSTKEDVTYFLRFEAILITVPFVLLTLLFREKPEFPPSKTAQAEHLQKDSKKYRDILKVLFKNKNYLKLSASVSLTTGVITAFLSILDKSIKILGYAEPGKVIMNIVLVALITGVIGTFAYSTAVKKTKKYKLFSMIISFGFFLGYMLVTIFLLTGIEQTWQISLLSILFGLNYLSGPPFFIVYGTQIAFPADQASVAGYLISIFHTFGFVLGIVLVAFVESSRQVIVIIFLVLGGIILIGAILTTTIDEDLRKDKYQQNLLRMDEVWNEQQGTPQKENPQTDLSLNKDTQS